jgi:hypothetical protein
LPSAITPLRARADTPKKRGRCHISRLFHQGNRARSVEMPAVQIPSDGFFKPVRTF